MLLKSKITLVNAFTDGWFAAKLGKFSSSEIWQLCGEKGLGQVGLSYIYRKVGEEATGLPAKDDFQNNATNHGNAYEPENLKLFAEKKGIEFLITQKLITEENSRFASTPDALIVLRENQETESYSVETVEAKSPYSFDAYIRLFLCDSPADVKEQESKYYWQVLDQLDTCGALKGYLTVYHPSFRFGSQKIIEFRVMDQNEKKEFPIKRDLDFLRSRKALALTKFNEVRNKLLNQ